MTKQKWIENYELLRLSVLNNVVESIIVNLILSNRIQRNHFPLTPFLIN